VSHGIFSKQSLKRPKAKVLSHKLDQNFVIIGPSS